MSPQDLKCAKCGGRLFHGYDHSCPINRESDLLRENAELRAASDKLEQFFREVMAVTFEGGDWDGDELQDKAEAMGLAHYEPYDPAKHDAYGYEMDIELGEPVLVLNLPAQKEEGRPKIKRLEDAIAWALGEGDSDFGDNKPENAKPFWWRNELRKRARGDGGERA